MIFMRNLCLYVFIFCCWEMNSAYAVSRNYLMKKCQQFKESSPPPIVQVIYNYGELTVDKEKSSAEISKIYAKIHALPPPAETDDDKKGMTVFNAYDKVGVSVAYQVLSDGYVCVIPAEFKVFVGFENTIVYLDKALEPKSCLYNQTWRHELQHLDLAHEALSLYVWALKSRIGDIVADVGVKISKVASEKVANDFANEYRSRLAPISALFQGTLTQEQAKLDTDENYRKEEKLCY